MKYLCSMSWQIIQKSYGRDKRYDAVYHIRYNAVSISFDVVCRYMNDSYKWLLFCESPQVQNVLLGHSPKVTDIHACRKAVAYIEQALENQRIGVANAVESLDSQLEKEQERIRKN